MKVKYSMLFCLLFAFLLLACEPQPVVKKSKKSKKSKPHYVEVILVRPTSQSIILTRSGTLRARREVKIYNQEEGKVKLMPFYEGDKVKKNELIAKLDDTLLQAQLHRARVTREKAQQDLGRIKTLHNERLSSDEKLNETESLLKISRADEGLLKTRLGYTRLYAPFSGVISERNLEPGSVAERYTHLLTLSDPSSLITEVHVSALLIPQLKVKDTVKVRIDALGGQLYPGHISRIHPNIDPITRRGTIEVEIKSVPLGAKPGQFCRVKIASPTTSRMMIPFKSMRHLDEQDYVYIVDDQNQAQRLTIVSGLRIGEQVEVISGLQDNQKVVSKGFLDSFSLEKKFRWSIAQSINKSTIIEDELIP